MTVPATEFANHGAHLPAATRCRGTIRLVPSKIPGMSLSDPERFSVVRHLVGRAFPATMFSREGIAMGSRRGHGEGGIYQRESDGKWCCAVEIGWVDGKRKRKVLYGKTRREVAEKLKVVLRDQQQGLPVALDQRQTVAQFLEHWHKDVAQHTLATTTYEGYGRRIRIDILPYLGRHVLTKLTPQDLTRFYSAMLDKGQSSRTVQYDHAILHKALDQAVRWNLIPRNPADAVDSPRPGKATIHPLTVEESERFLSAAKHDRLYCLYALALATGMRQGEILGLRWVDINWQGKSLHVRQQTQRTKKNGLVLTAPKTARSRRTITVPASILDALRAHREQQAESDAIGPHWTDHDLVFPNLRGGMIERQNLQRRSFKPLLIRAGLDPEKVRFHDLRHTHATLLLTRGVNPKVVQERLGHATVSITLDVYSHVIPSLQEEVAEKLGDLFTPTM